MKHHRFLAWSEMVLLYRAGEICTGVQVPELLFSHLPLGGYFPAWLCSPPAWKHFLGSQEWLLARGWGAVVKEFSLLIGEEPLRDGKWSSPWVGTILP